MKRLAFFILILTMPAAANAMSLFLGPSLGTTSLSSANGSPNRDSQFSLGAESSLFFNKWAAGLSYKYFAPSQDGNAAINVNQTNQWLSVEGKYRIWDLNFSPYVSGGLGTLLQTVSTQVMGTTDRQSGVYFVRDIGLGLMGRVTRALGVGVGVRYFQYSNVNGFDYVLTLGYCAEVFDHSTHPFERPDDRVDDRAGN